VPGPGAFGLLTISRVYHTAERPVETADIIIPVERYALFYQVPVRWPCPGRQAAEALREGLHGAGNDRDLTLNPTVK
jgi:hypothetical protein